MGRWEERVVPHLVDRALDNRFVDRERALVCAGLTGEVLELGFGSGLNTGHYPEAVTRVTAVEPSQRGWDMSADRRGRSPVPVVRGDLDGQRLSAGDASYDAVLSTFTLCTIPEPALALAEVRRVLRPGGALHVLEHARSPQDGVRRWQRRLDPVQRRVAGGCHLTRDVVGLLRDAGFEVRVDRAAYLPGPRLSHPWTYVVRVRATP